MRRIFPLCVALCLIAGCHSEDIPVSHPVVSENDARGHFEKVCIDGYTFVTWTGAYKGGLTQFFVFVPGSGIVPKRCGNDS